MYSDNSLTKLIKGYLMRKNIGLKKMIKKLDNPRLLLLKGGIEYIAGTETNILESLSKEQALTE